MGLLPAPQYFFYFYTAGIDFRRQNLTSKVNFRAVRARALEKMRKLERMTEPKLNDRWDLEYETSDRVVLRFEPMYVRHGAIDPDLVYAMQSQKAVTAHFSSERVTAFWLCTTV